MSFSNVKPPSFYFDRLLANWCIRFEEKILKLQLQVHVYSTWVCTVHMWVFVCIHLCLDIFWKAAFYCKMLEMYDRSVKGKPLPDNPLYVGDGGLGSSDSCSEKNITGSGSLYLFVKQCLTGSCKVYLRGSDSFRPCMYTLTLSSSSGSSALLGLKSSTKNYISNYMNNKLHQHRWYRHFLMFC